MYIYIYIYIHILVLVTYPKSRSGTPRVRRLGPQSLEAGEALGGAHIIRASLLTPTPTANEHQGKLITGHSGSLVNPPGWGWGSKVCPSY